MIETGPVRRRLSAIGLGVALVFAAGSARASPAGEGQAPEPSDGPRVELSWEVPEGCPTREQLIERSEVLLGRSFGEAGDPDLVVAARIAARGERWVLELDFDAPGDRLRTLEGRDCEELLEAAALILATTVDPAALLDEFDEDEDEAELEPDPEAPAKEPEPVEDEEPAVAAVPVEEPRVEDPPDAEPEGLGGFVGLAGGVGFGPLPSLAGAPILALGLRRRALRVELLGGAWFSLPALVEGSPEVGARVWLGWAALRGCGVPRVGPEQRVELPLCAGLELGGMRAESFGVDQARAGTLAWLAVDAGIAVIYRFGAKLGLRLGVDGVVPLLRPGFTVAGLGELHRAAPVGVQGSLGVEVRFGGGSAARVP